MLISNKEFKVQVPVVHPKSFDYEMFWDEQLTRVEAGMWFSGKWMPGRLYYYSNFHHIFMNKGKLRQKVFSLPDLRDLEWEWFLLLEEARGFSGFDGDEYYTCHRRAAILNDLTDEEKLALREEHPEIWSDERLAYKEYIPARAYLRQIHHKNLGIPIYNNDAQNFLLMSGRGVGKAEIGSSRLHMKDREVLMKDISIGDQIYDPDGHLTTVTAIQDFYDRPVYKIIDSDGRESICDENHEWFLYNYNGYRGWAGKIFESKQIAAIGVRNKHYQPNFYFKVADPLPFEEKELLIDPYVLGSFLGDGDMNHSTPRFSTNDKESIDLIMSRLGDDYHANRDFTNNNYCISYKGDLRKLNVNNAMGKYNPLHHAIKNLGLNVKCGEKFIPSIYKYGSIEQRMELVRGLMDTDGSISKSGKWNFQILASS